VEGSWSRRCLRIGHAGAAAHAPPNTLKSLALALDLGVDMVEFDVRACRDALVLLHDDDLSHFPGGQGLAS
jgi:glycerophosphoryl diester phosphodiesterase